MFDGIESPEIKASRDSNYLRRGHYLVRIDRVKSDKTRPPKNRPFVAIETTVVHTFADGDGRDLQGQMDQLDQQWHKPGDTPSQLLMADMDTFLPNIKSFVSNVMAVPESQVTVEACNEMCSEENPLGGMVVEVNNRMIKTTAGNDFTKINWVREWRPSEFSKVVDVDLLEALFPNLEALLENE
jgi:hypothetical protein